jgi:hypothetical protein
MRHKALQRPPPFLPNQPGLSIFPRADLVQTKPPAQLNARQRPRYCCLGLVLGRGSARVSERKDHRTNEHCQHHGHLLRCQRHPSDPTPHTHYAHHTRARPTRWGSLACPTSDAATRPALLAPFASAARGHARPGSLARIRRSDRPWTASQSRGSSRSTPPPLAPNVPVHWYRMYRLLSGQFRGQFLDNHAWKGPNRSGNA